ncbi:MULTISPECIES: type III-B CRISPR module-associated Cmr3 family protein [Pyrobaculum]|uniref:CRISPR-associated protein, Cmr3 family n=1 Tax=Pyrobaculum arsenaticum (strain DSM 13514 / JCM 11321 / PZ6) TaxID=340102 RepID=A4WJY0_PYRAR|nr:type III-B CRISPR module-associated Cmr3 family protein [Pyrobaculum arsenaticum]ABP50697.1 CRISPR-associated protein, Cmr3 family [Pyrobaculum arsenaticum DSM 13514]MCY0891133.1 CRISPR-associated protein [Pyrobaculum arsenaticum]
MKVVIKPLGYARIAARPPSTPSIAARDEATAAPPPSTVLGMLGALKGIVAQCPGPGPQGAERQLVELAQALGVRSVWGPLVEIDGVLHAPGLDSLYAVKGGRVERRAISTIRRVGLALSAFKTAAPGFLYTATYVAEKAKYIYYIDADGLRGGVARLGGEGRLALVEVEEGEADIPEEITGRAILLTPLLIPEGRPPQCLRPLGVFEERGGAVEIAPKVRVVQWGLGFSEVCRERRPMYPAIAPGTVVEATRCGRNVGYLAELGYGALMPL